MLLLFNPKKVNNGLQHATHGGVVFMLDRLMNTIETKRLYSALLRLREADGAFHQSYAQHGLLFSSVSHASSVPRMA